MANELSKSLAMIASPTNEKHQMAKMLIAFAKMLESQNAVGHQVCKKIYNDVSIEFGFHGVNDLHGHKESVNYKRMKRIAEGMFYVDMSATTHEAVGGIITSLDWENAQIENYQQYANLEQFFIGATSEQAEAIKRLGEKIKHPSPKSAHSNNSDYGSSQITLDRDFKTGKFDIVTSASYYDGNRYEFVDYWEGPYVASELSVWDKVDLGGRSIADVPPAELEALVYNSYASLADKEDYRLKEEDAKVLSVEEQIKRGYAPKLTIAEKAKVLVTGQRRKEKPTAESVALLAQQPAKSEQTNQLAEPIIEVKESKEVLEKTVLADIEATFKIETGADGKETPESFVARMDATNAMMKKMMQLAQYPDSGIQVFSSPRTKGDMALDEILQAQYDRAKKVIDEKEKQEQIRGTDSSGIVDPKKRYHHLPFNQFKKTQQIKTDYLV